MKIKTIKLLVFAIMLAGFIGCGLKGSPDFSHKIIQSYFSKLQQLFSFIQNSRGSTISIKLRSNIQY
ncbi:hypothetical protein [Candidatus Erwinia haradaeae]|uniref:hypothetical protein n=1 Tax=Candidatus Erwinia haradaeae TaxID=1922217 RepID=UPI0009336A5D|nr:hypothetical protein [Candidatus Erwinia haradaeae]